MWMRRARAAGYSFKLARLAGIMFDVETFLNDAAVSRFS
jgi:hypothetical protein